MAIEHSEFGTEVEIGKIDGHQKRIPATVVPLPFYDPRKNAGAHLKFLNVSPTHVNDYDFISLERTKS